MVATIKFSQFSPVNYSTANKVVGYGGGDNFQEDSPAIWTIAGRPIAPSNGTLGFNTDLQQYEYYDVISASWVQLASSTSSLIWNNITTTTATMSGNNGYVANNAGVVTLTLPATCTFGSIIRVSGYGSGGWNIVFNPGQNLVYGAIVATTTTGNLGSTNQFDQVELLCVVADTTFIALNSQGNLTII